MSARFAVSDVEVEVEEPEALPNGDTTPPPPSQPADQKKMDFLTVSGARDNVERNQFTVTSTASGNLALYYEVG